MYIQSSLSRSASDKRFIINIYFNSKLSAYTHMNSTDNSAEDNRGVTLMIEMY